MRSSLRSPTPRIRCHAQRNRFYRDIDRNFARRPRDNPQISFASSIKRDFTVDRSQYSILCNGLRCGATGTLDWTGRLHTLDSIEPKRLPLVSVIVVNYNYARFLAESVASVYNQTYKNIECIIVDDCSTDDSEDVIAGLLLRFPNLKIRRNIKNGGQSISFLNGFMESTGNYVIFLDADDYLLPSCVECHIQCHLSLRLAVGLTSVDMVQLSDDRIVTTTSQGFSEFTRSGLGMENGLLRANRFDLGDDCVSARSKITNDKIHYVAPKYSSKWPWSPTSGNCFRRDALDLIMDNRSFAAMRSCTDIYLLRGVASLTESVLIDHPLVVYRIHGSNIFIRNATVHRMRVFDTDYLKSRSTVAMTMIIDHIMDNFSSLVTRVESPDYLIDSLNALDEVWPPVARKRFGLSYLAQALVIRRTEIVASLGLVAYNKWLVQRILPEGRRPKQGIVHTSVLLAFGFLAMSFFTFASQRLKTFRGRIDSPGERS